MIEQNQLIDWLRNELDSWETVRDDREAKIVEDWEAAGRPTGGARQRMDDDRLAAIKWASRDRFTDAIIAIKAWGRIEALRDLLRRACPHKEVEKVRLHRLPDDTVEEAIGKCSRCGVWVTDTDAPKAMAAVRRGDVDVPIV